MQPKKAAALCVGVVSVFFVLALIAAYVGGRSSAPGALKIRPLQYSDLPEWGGGHQSQALPVFLRSCERLTKADPAAPFLPAGTDPLLKTLYGTKGDWQEVCQKAQNLKSSDDQAARSFFEDHFAPVLISQKGREKGLFTGYYEAELTGRATKQPGFETPLLARPDDLVMVQLGDFRADLSARRIAGRISNGRLYPYENRAEIEEGALDTQNLALAWVSDPVDAFFLHIQGSGRVRLADGTALRVGYEAQNGHPYTAIGRVLRDRGALPPGGISMQSIRAWLAAHPNEAQEIMNANASYIFFREIDVKDQALGPFGAQNIALTPRRSLAVDPRFTGLGALVWLAADRPDKTGTEDMVLRRLFVAQDTGGAIKGAQRADVFWGFGEDAENIAGYMQHEGTMYVLVPRILVQPLFNQ